MRTILSLLKLETSLEYFPVSNRKNNFNSRKCVLTSDKSVHCNMEQFQNLVEIFDKSST